MNSRQERTSSTRTGAPVGRARSRWALGLWVLVAGVCGPGPDPRAQGAGVGASAESSRLDSVSPPRLTIECFAAVGDSHAGQAPVALRLVRLRSAPDRQVLHREVRYPELGWVMHDVEELAGRSRRLVHRELGPRRGFTLLSSWALSAPIEASVDRDALGLGSAPQQSFERPRRLPELPSPWQLSSPLAAQDLSTGLLPGHSVYSGGAERWERDWSASGQTLGPLELLERARAIGTGVSSMTLIAPETGLPEPIEQHLVCRVGPGGCLRRVVWTRADGSQRMGAWFLGQNLIAFDASGRCFQAIDLARYRALTGTAGLDLR